MEQRLDTQDLEKIIRDYVANVIHMSLATCAGNKPWICEVLVAFDNDLNLYFFSLPDTRHCQEIAKNPQVAGNIVEPHVKGQPPRGVYFEGTAQKLDGVDENHVAYTSYRDRFDRGPEMLEEARKPEGLHFYKISVRNFYLFDARDSKPGRKYLLAWSK
jgi:uncharacterized protein YhbP (UPF0306 family)